MFRGCLVNTTTMKGVGLTHTSIDMQGALRLGYKVVEYIEVWHYSEGGSNMFDNDW